MKVRIYTVYTREREREIDRFLLEKKKRLLYQPKYIFLIKIKNLNKIF